MNDKLNRITITIRESLEKKLRTKQAELILKRKKNFSFSQVFTIYLIKGLKNGWKASQRKMVKIT